ncbi:MAG TPA: ParB/RepB/Spo0J family partition protein [Candidatus Deferrimicrobiaceae bacterium]|jgi:ParB family chromosome partitioning protein|nr:ParB/RepB/Spo0J family partition protein [Candidatus Deferrimicrobiaceae bacterium]
MERKPDPVKRKVLGRGLSALLPGPSEREPDFLRIPVSEIRGSGQQPRRSFAPEELRDLVESIREKGVLQPVIVRPTAAGYELVAGERRLRAAQAAGVGTIPAIVKKFSDRESLEAALVENVQRADLNAIELAEAYQRLAAEFSLSHEEIARRVGKDRVTVANTVRLLRLPADVKQAVVDGRLSAGHARALLSAPAGRLVAIFEVALRKGLSVREVERLCQEGERKGTRRKPQRHDPHLKDLEDRLSRMGGTRVRVRGTPKKGRIEVSYFSEGEFQRLCEILFGGK